MSGPGDFLPPTLAAPTPRTHPVQREEPASAVPARKAESRRMTMLPEDAFLRIRKDVGDQPVTPNGKTGRG